MSNYWLFLVVILLFINSIGTSIRDNYSRQELREIKAELVKLNQKVGETK